MTYKLKPKGWKRVLQTELSRYKGPVTGKHLCTRKQKGGVAEALGQGSEEGRGGPSRICQRICILC